MRLTGPVLALALSAAARPAAAQERPQQPEARQQQESTIDVSKLPLDLRRIERELERTREREEFENMRLRAFVDVFGRAPQIEFFAPNENLSTGPVPWGAPTHQQMLDIMTPQEFRAPAMDFAAFMRWLQDKTRK
ncbi:MAG: hypothetical protein AB7P99_01985 [Vicinamibacterales bacterium]